MNINQKIDEYIKVKHYSKINSVLLYQRGEVVAERYYNGFKEDSRNVIKSVAKSIMSICVGICLDKGMIKSMDEPIYKFLPEFNKGISPLHRAITIRHLLMMTSGIYWNGGVHYHCPMLIQMHRSGNWIEHIADCAVTATPGTKYEYKEWDVILLAKVLDCICTDMYDFLEENLYQPLHIKSQRWYKSPCGVYYSVADGDEGICESYANLTAKEMLRIGQLFLQGGIFEGQKILSEDYIKQVTSPSKCNQGYGLLWWIGENWYGCRGYGGQNITVFPSTQTIAVMQATPTSRGRGYEDVIWDCVKLHSFS